MALFKCKMCGGDLETVEGVTITECEYCGTKQTVPKVLDENLQNLFNRANTLRIKSEFDKAEKLYERIIQADPTQPEAYWGLILCKYGIEYVDDPATYKKVPTCHRASYDSVIADDDYKSALKNADITQRTIYEEQAKEIDRIQKEILALAQKEENYDVFICYKETDENGRRTQDSVIANDIYYQLKQEGFKVFYAAITLEGKLGSAYEPIIFAALNSAKVMLAIGTKPEYFNAVWVKNEWSRYIKIIKKDRSKLLIPCYRDMDAYDLPEEFSHLQAQDMSKIGFINDIVRGIQKVIKKDEPKATVVTPATANTETLLKRVFMFLEDGDWDSADEYCEKVLDIDPENGKAYLGKLMAELHAKRKRDLVNCEEPFDNNKNYQKVVRFCDAVLISELKGYIATIKDRNAKSDEAREKEDIYLKAVSYFNSYNAVKIADAIRLFTSLSGYKDSNEYIRLCEARIEELKKNFHKEREREAEKKRIEAEKKRIEEENARKEREREAEKERIEEENARKEEERKAEIARLQAAKLKKKQGILSCIAFSLLFLGLISYFVIYPAISYINEDFAPYIKIYNIKEFEIPIYINEINDSAFRDCKSLTNVKIHDYVTSIGDSAFRDCKSLTTVEFGDNSQLESIGNSAFSGCESLTGVKIPDSVTSIGDAAFYNSYSLGKIVIPDSVTTMGKNVFATKSGRGYSYTIYCESKTEPSGWNNGWNNTGIKLSYKVVWGYTGN